jgi:hypothetical protein
MPQHFSDQPTNFSSYSGNTNSKDFDASALNFIGFSIICLPILIISSVFSYKKYRATVLRRQRAILEKIWLMKVTNNTYRQD